MRLNLGQKLGDRLGPLDLGQAHGLGVTAHGKLGFELAQAVESGLVHGRAPT